MTFYDILIVGAGHGGAHVAIALRQGGYGGTIALVGEEAVLPYERPPLSKEYAAGEKSAERLLIRPASFWTERGVVVRLGERVVVVDPARRRVVTDDSTEIGYGKLVWAAGGTPRRLNCAGADLAGIHTIRTIADVDRLLAEVPAASSIVVVGGGYIGLEAAATLIKLGKRVTLVEASDRVLARVAGQALSRFFEDEHRARGVDLLLAAAVKCIEGTTRVTGVRLAGGEVLDAQIAVVGIGIVPAVEPCAVAGADGADGVRVDGSCRTSLPHIFAIGDCALHANRYADGREVRLESVQNATDQAAVVARTILGQDSSYDAVPWFWSNQYDLKLQTVGLSAGHDEAVVRGDPETRRFSVVYLRRRRVVALDCVNAVKDYVQGKRLVVEGARIDPARLADPETPLKDM